MQSHLKPLMNRQCADMDAYINTHGFDKYIKDFGMPMPPPLKRSGSSSCYNHQYDDQNIYRNLLIDPTTGTLIPEPADNPLAIYGHLIDMEEDSFERGDITDIGAFIRENGIVSFMDKTKYKYSIPCILYYATAANNQKIYVANLRATGVFGTAQ